MRLHVLVEGPSDVALLEAWLPRALPRHSFKVYPHEGRGNLPADPTAPADPLHRGLLDQLPAKMRAFGRALDPTTDALLVLVDADQDDCRHLEQAIVAALAHCHPAPRHLIRVAVEETEAFYLGDLPAVRRAFRKVRPGQLRDYIQDSQQGTWERFQRYIGWRHEAKVRWARHMGPELGTARRGNQLNRSPSFVAMYKAAVQLVGDAW